MMGRRYHASDPVARRYLGHSIRVGAPTMAWKQRDDSVRLDPMMHGYDRQWSQVSHSGIVPGMSPAGERRGMGSMWNNGLRAVGW
jgi:hypothetical protein